MPDSPASGDQRSPAKAVELREDQRQPQAGIMHADFDGERAGVVVAEPRIFATPQPSATAIALCSTTKGSTEVENTEM